jgi:hypothetical protein
MMQRKTDEQPSSPESPRAQSADQRQLKDPALPAQQPGADRPQLKRVLGRWDLVLLFVVAVFNLNVQ